jgi:hypothetical protein
MLQRQRALRKQQQQTKQQSQRQLPPGKQGGPVDKNKAAKPIPPRPKQSVDKVRVRDLGSTKPQSMSGGTPRALPPGRQGGQLAKAPKGGAMTRVAGAAGKATSTAAGLGGRMLGAAGTALMIPSAIKNIADVAERNRQWDAYKERMGMNKPKPTNKPSSSTAGRRTGTNNRSANLSVPTSPAGTRAGAAAGTRTRSRVTPQSTDGKDWRSRVGNSDVNDLRQKQNEVTSSYGKKPDAPKPAAQASPKSSTPKPAEKVPASNAGMKNQNKDFRGNPNRKDSIASTLSELRSMGSGRKVEGVGPVASGSDYAKARNDAAISKAQSDANKARIKQGPGPKNETLKERMERMKKRRQGTSIGGVD